MKRAGATGTNPNLVGAPEMIDDCGNTTQADYRTCRACGFNQPVRKVPYHKGVTITALLYHVLK
jgi:hypothetical protein